MTAKQYRAALKKCGLSQRGAARLFNINERTSRRYALGEQPVSRRIAAALVDLAAGKVTASDIEQRATP